MLPCILAHAGEVSFESLPFHPIFVNFTAALIPTSLVFDLLGAWTKKESLKAAGWWTLLLAACLTPITILFGWLWMKSMPDMGQWEMHYHKWLGTSLGVLFICLAIWRGFQFKRGRGPGWLYAIVAIVLLGGLMVQGDLGGAMSFERGIVITNESATENSEHPNQPSERPATASQPASTTRSHLSRR
jgi:uncharacterized membrane protein